MTVLSGLIPCSPCSRSASPCAGSAALGEAANGLNRLVANVALPALLLLKWHLTAREERLAVLMAACASLVVAVTAAAWWLAAAWRLRPAQRGVLARPHPAVTSRTSHFP